MAGPLHPAIFLFKDPDEPDAFALSVTARTDRPAVCVPVLRTQLELNGLAAALCGPDLQFDALVVTSHRACDALFEVLKELPPAHASKLVGRRVFVVGRRTAAAIRVALPSLSSSDVLGADAGSAEKLAPIILRDLSLRPEGGAKKPPLLLFICGDKRLDTLPRQLRAEGVGVTEIVAYSTAPTSPTTIEEVCFATGRESANAAAFVFFSPSGIDAALSSDLVRDAVSRGVPCVALGPTTAQALKRLGLAVAAVAASPTPEALADAVQRAIGDAKHRAEAALCVGGTHAS